MVTAFSRGTFLGRQGFKNDEVILVFIILFLWGVVLSIFFQRWGEEQRQGEIPERFHNSGKIRSLLPYQPVYSKEMAETIEQRETEKNLRSIRTSFSFYPVDCDSDLKAKHTLTSDN